MIIDSHCHAGKGDRLTGPWGTDAPWGLPAAGSTGKDRPDRPLRRFQLLLAGGERGRWPDRGQARARRKPVPAALVPLTRSTTAARFLRPAGPLSPAPGAMGDRGDPWAADQFPADQLSYPQTQR
jgi:hypothetical protein